MVESVDLIHVVVCLLPRFLPRALQKGDDLHWRSKTGEFVKKKMRSKLRREKQASKHQKGPTLLYLPSRQWVAWLNYVHFSCTLMCMFIRIELRFCWTCFKSLAQNARVDYFSISNSNIQIYFMSPGLSDLPVAQCWPDVVLSVPSTGGQQGQTWYHWLLCQSDHPWSGQEATPP